jgi:dTDP-4-amino-4,6-dideoxygalactose transaminase
VTALRVLPPVHSPVTPGAILAGAGACFDGAAKARAAVGAALTEYYGPRAILLTDSGTSALALALRAGAARAPGPVALPAYSCYDVATAADAAEVDVLLYDLDPATLTPDAAALRAVLERGARTVVITHLYGVPVEPAAVNALLAGYDAVLVEDAAQGAGARHGGRPLGSYGSLAVLSFGRGKGITAGRGGALLANDPDGLASLARAAERLGPGRTSASEPVALLAQWLLARPALYGIPASLPFLGLGDTIYRPPHHPRGMSTFALGVLSRSLASAEREAEVRRANAARLLAATSRSGGSVTAVRSPTAAMPGYLRLPVLVSQQRRERFRSGAARHLGIMPGYPGTLAELRRFTRARNPAEVFPGARELVTSLFTLPTHGLLSQGDVAELERWIVEPNG